MHFLTFTRTRSSMDKVFRLHFVHSEQETVNKFLQKVRGTILELSTSYEKGDCSYDWKNEDLFDIGDYRQYVDN